MPTIPMYILAGGRSTRFGSDKARAVVHGRPLIQHLADALRPAAAAITVVADLPDKFADLGLRTLADRTPDGGPMSGIEVALEDPVAPPDAGWRFIVSCDWVGARAVWVEQLLAAVAIRDPQPDQPAPRAAAFFGERWEPLFAVYHNSLLTDLRLLRTRGAPAPWRLLECAAACKLPLPADWSQMAQINTPKALAAWLAR